MEPSPAPTPLSAPEALAPVNHLGRILGVFFSPKKTFEEIALRPTWLAPVILMTILSVIASFSINQRVDWRDYMNRQLEQSPRAAQLSPEQRQRQIELGARFAPISVYVFGTLGYVARSLFVAGVLLGAFNVLGNARLGYKTSLSIVAHAFLPAFVSSVLLIAVLFLKPLGSVDVENPLATNLAAFLPAGIPLWLEKMTGSFDLFSFWIIFLLGVGFAAANPRKLTAGKSAGIVIAAWAVYVLARTGLALIFS